MNLKDILDSRREDDLYSAGNGILINPREQKRRSRVPYETTELDSDGSMEIRCDGIVYDAFFLPEHDIKFTRQVRKLAAGAIHVLDDDYEPPPVDHQYLYS